VGEGAKQGALIGTEKVIDKSIDKLFSKKTRAKGIIIMILPTLVLNQTATPQ